MSYKPLKKTDSFSELVSQLKDCKMICDHMLEKADDFDEWILWFTKAKKINVHFTYRFIKANESRFTDKEINYAYNVIGKKNVDINEFID